MIVSDIIAKKLYLAGCRHAFGVPGGEVLSIIKALDKVGVKYHLVRHENNGGFMAEGTWHASGAPGILVATVGPGVVNAVNVIANAWQDGVPLICLTGCFGAHITETYTHQVIDHSAILSPVTKASFVLGKGVVETQIERAILIALSEKPGPVHIDVPMQLSIEEEKCTLNQVISLPEPICPVFGSNFAFVRQSFAVAKRPLIIAGLGVLYQNSEEAVASICKKFSIPLITTFKAKGVLSEDHPLSLGGHGLSSLTFSILKPLLNKSDLIILCGYDPVEMRLDWVNSWPEKGTTVIEFSAISNKNLAPKPNYCFVGDISAGLKALCADIHPSTVWLCGSPAKVRSALSAAFPIDEEWGPAGVIAAAHRALPKGGVATVDTGAHRILLSQQWKCIFPKRLFQSTGFCTMGAALPIAVGYKLAKRKTPVLCLTGDGGLEMIFGELLTIRDLKLGIPIVVFVDSSLALIELKQRLDGNIKLGVEFGQTDYANAANALGGYGVTATSRKEVESSITMAFLRKTFTIIACPIGSQAYDGKF